MSERSNEQDLRSCGLVPAQVRILFPALYFYSAINNINTGRILYDMGLNLGISLDEFKKRWGDSYLQHKGTCPYHDSMYKKGWIPLAMEPYAPALGRFHSDDKLAKKLVKILETKGKYELKNEMCSKDALVSAVQAITLNETKLDDMFYLIYDYGFCSLMLDRNAYTTTGNLNEFDIQWYIHK